ncbi:Abi-alpha family protein [Antrihabitans sp. NCIMB 15449]|uniref:Abi-alpha family protein n=1 Tax=Antrihabitans spumae TaxID=3373370 RepID=A0ABW7JPV9_9NOCA
MSEPSGQQGSTDVRVLLSKLLDAVSIGPRDAVKAAVALTRDLETADDLRKRGNKLIRDSHNPESQPRRLHPAFSRIMDDLTPDEARILRFLAVAGPQPVVDVRTKTLFQLGSEQLAEGVSMIAEMASCRWPDRDYHYFANLHRLGLLRFSKEPVDDVRRYALIEVQPRALDAMARAKKSITIYRSIRLSVFGAQFCETCFDTTGYHAGGWDSDERGDKIIGPGPPDPSKKHHH